MTLPVADLNLAGPYFNSDGTPNAAGLLMLRVINALKERTGGIVSDGVSRATVTATGGASDTLDDWMAALTTVVSGLAAHLADTTAAHAASAISVTPAGSLAATDVQAGLVEVLGDVEAHVADTSAAHAASAISYSGGTGMSATDVEAAIDELATEKANAASLGTAAAEDVGTSGHAIPFCDSAAEISAAWTFEVPPVFDDQTGSLNALGATWQLFACSTSSMAGGSSHYFGPAGNNATELSALFMVSRACAVTRVRVLTVAPGGSDTRTVTVRKNLASSSMTGVISASGTSVDITANPVSLAQNDYFSILIANSGGAASASFCLVAIELTPA